MTESQFDELFEKTPKLPRNFRKWAKEQCSGNYVLFYRPDKSGGTRFTCSACGKTYVEAVWPADRSRRTCPKCGMTGEVVHDRVRRPLIRYRKLQIGQKCGKGYVLREFRAVTIGIAPRAEGRIVTGGGTFRLVERRRIYIAEKGGKNLYNHPDREWLWASPSGYRYDWVETETHRWNGGGNQRGQEEAVIYPGTFEAMKGTPVEYSCAEVALGSRRLQCWVDLWDWLKLYGSSRKLEMLWKLGLYGLVRHRLKKCGGLDLRGGAKTPWGYLGIRKDRIKDLSQSREQVKALEIFQAERKAGERWDGGTVEMLLRIRITKEQIWEMRRFMSLKQLTNRIRAYEKQTRTGYERIWTEYRDYLRMREELGYDMTNSIYLHPRDLAGAHQAMVEERNERITQRKKEEMERIYGGIRTRYKRAAKVYGFGKDGLLIRPAKSATEIIEEGRTLHHCVGRGGYLEKHSERRTIILLLRRVEEPDVPYVTVEVNPDGTVRQWYGAYDKKPDEKRNDEWLEAYCGQLDKDALRREARKPAKRAACKA